MLAYLWRSGKSRISCPTMNKKKKIIFILNNFYPGGVEKLICDLVPSFDSDKFSVGVLAVVGGGIMLENFRKHAPVFLAGRVESYQNIIGKVLWVISLPLVLVRVVAHLYKEKPDVVVTSLYHADVIGISVAYILGIKRRIVIQHDVYKLSGLRKLIKMGLCIKKATGFIAISNTVAGFLTEYFSVPKEMVKVIKNGVDVTRFATASKPLDTANPIIGSVGRLESEKGYGVLVAALVALKRKGREPSVVIVGGGGEEKELKLQAVRAGLENVLWTGAVGDPIAYLKGMDVFVMPSLEEGFGLTVAEALAARKVIVASNLPAIKETIRDGVNGILFKTGDADDLANKLYSLLTDKAFLQAARNKTDRWLDANSSFIDIKKTRSEYLDFLGL